MHDHIVRERAPVSQRMSCCRGGGVFARHWFFDSVSQQQKYNTLFALRDRFFLWVELWWANSCERIQTLLCVFLK